MRHMLASVILRLLGNRMVHEDANLTFCPTHSLMVKKEVESPSEASFAAFADLPGECLFGRMLLILHGLLSSCQPSWLGLKNAAKSTNETSKDSSSLVRELAESLQVCPLVTLFFNLDILTNKISISMFSKFTFRFIWIL